MVEVERVKSESRALNPNAVNQKRKWIEQGATSGSVNKNQKELTPGPPRNHPTGLAVPYEKCGRTNHTNPNCRVGTYKYMWCGSL